MRWKTESWGEYKARLSQYKPWFAWYPVFIDGYTCWLETVLRRYDFTYFIYDGCQKEAVYKLPSEGQ